MGKSLLWMAVVAACSQPGGGASLRVGTVTFPALADGAVEVAGAGMTVRFALRGADAVPAEDDGGGQIAYRGAWHGADVVHRALAGGDEDFVALDARPADERLDYDVELAGVAGLRLVRDTLELLDAGGAPRLRVAAPYAIDARGVRTAATLAVTGCAYDASPAAPWHRAVVAPGGARCTVTVRWHAASYPAVVDPVWQATGAMTDFRSSFTATLLGNGLVLVAGNATADLYDDATGTFAATGAMSESRNGPTASLLPDGTVLVAGGTEDTSAEIYDPVAGTFALAKAPMVTARARHTATTLASGLVLLAGGRNLGGATDSAELYDPVAGTFTATGFLGESRSSHTATLLANGKVLIAGGGNTSTTSEAELYDPVAGTFTKTGSMHDTKSGHTATLLRSGDVLITGGTLIGNNSLDDTELYDPALGTFSLGPTMSIVRNAHAATMLATGKVLIAGGANPGAFGGGAVTNLADLYDPATNTIAPTASMVVAREGQVALALPSGRVLIAGGDDLNHVLSSAERFFDLVDADACGSDAECDSGHCADGVCCDRACTGQCEACDAAGEAGTCTVVTGAPHASHTPCAGSGACVGTCDGTTADACAFPGAATACGTACGGDGVSEIGLACDGAGGCEEGSDVVGCGEYACAGSACEDSCGSDADCAPAMGLACVGSVCEVPSGSGSGSGSGGSGNGSGNGSGDGSGSGDGHGGGGGCAAGGGQSVAVALVLVALVERRRQNARTRRVWIV